MKGKNHHCAFVHHGEESGPAGSNSVAEVSVHSNITWLEPCTEAGGSHWDTVSKTACTE